MSLSRWRSSLGSLVSFLRRSKTSRVVWPVRSYFARRSSSSQSYPSGNCFIRASRCSGLYQLIFQDLNQAIVRRHTVLHGQATVNVAAIILERLTDNVGVPRQNPINLVGGLANRLSIRGVQPYQG